MGPLTLLEQLRATLNCITEPTGFVILSDAIQYLTSPSTYTRRGFRDRVILRQEVAQ